MLGGFGGFPYCRRMDEKGRIILGDLERRGPAFKRRVSQFNKASQTWEVFSETSTEEAEEDCFQISARPGKKITQRLNVFERLMV